MPEPPVDLERIRALGFIGAPFRHDRRNGTRVPDRRGLGLLEIAGVQIHKAPDPAAVAPDDLQNRFRGRFSFWAARVAVLVDDEASWRLYASDFLEEVHRIRESLGQADSDSQLNQHLLGCVQIGARAAVTVMIGLPHK